MFCWRFPYFWTSVSLSVTWTHNNNKWKIQSLCVCYFKFVPLKWVIPLSKYTSFFKPFINYISTREFTLTLCDVKISPLFCKVFVLGLHIFRDSLQFSEHCVCVCVCVCVCARARVNDSILVLQIKVTFPVFPATWINSNLLLGFPVIVWYMYFAGLFQ